MKQESLCCGWAVWIIIALLNFGVSALADSPPNATSGRVGPLLEAIGTGDRGRVLALLNAGVNPDEPEDARSPMVQAITSLKGDRLRCDLGIVKLLLAHGADPNRPDPAIGALPLQTALEVGDLECARIIKEAGGHVGSLDDRGQSVLTAAASAASRTGNTGLIDAVFGWGVSPNTRDRDGSTALHMAVWSNNAAVVKYLLDRGVDPCLRNGIGQTPLDMARNLGRANEIVAMLSTVTSGCLRVN
jgi:hypothetical protein